MPKTPLGSPGILKVDGSRVQLDQCIRVSMLPGADGYREDLLQRVIADSPSLLPLNDFFPATDAVYSLGREVPLDVGGQAGYIDNLLVTSDGHLVLVETKLWRNREATREVVAQVLQYGMALTALSVRELEATLRLPDGQSILSHVVGQAGQNGVADDFEDALERNLRRGELLYLIVSDGIRYSVERLTLWLEDGGSAPFKLGLIELRLFQTSSGDTLVVPKTLLKTREVSRHVVVVDIQGAGSATAMVQDDSSPESGTHLMTRRAVTPTSLPMSSEQLLEVVRSKGSDADALTAGNVARELGALGFLTRSTPSSLQFGIQLPDGDGSFHPLLTLQPSGAWSHPSSTLTDTMGDDQFVQHKLRLNSVGPFYRPAEALDPSKRRQELVAGFNTLAGKERDLARAIAATRDVIYRKHSE